MKNMKCCSDLKLVEPSDEWEHKALWRGVRDALSMLPTYFHSDTFIEGVSAVDVFAMNSLLDATVENQVVETLNSIRNVWDPFGKYGTCVFVRQPQSFPDVVLKDLSDEAARPIMGIELKGWYLLAKEGEPSLRFLQTEAACADADLIMVVPWTLNSVISGRPRIFTPFIESARFAAQYRNAHWRTMREGKDAEIIQPAYAQPYPKKSDATNDSPRSDKGGNFGRIARTGLMDEYLARMQIQPVCGIKASYWLEFFKIFHQDSTDQQIRMALDKLRRKVDSVVESEQRRTLFKLIDAIESHIEML